MAGSPMRSVVGWLRAAWFALLYSVSDDGMLPYCLANVLLLSLLLSNAARARARSHRGCRGWSAAGFTVVRLCIYFGGYSAINGAHERR